MNEDLVAMLERERLGGMPRWQVRPARPDRDSPEEVTRRRLELMAAEAEQRMNRPMQIVRRAS